MFAPDVPPVAYTICPLYVASAGKVVWMLGIYVSIRVSGLIVIGVMSISSDSAVTTVDTILRPLWNVPTMVWACVDDVIAILNHTPHDQISITPALIVAALLIETWFGAVPAANTVLPGIPTGFLNLAINAIIRVSGLIVYMAAPVPASTPTVIVVATSLSPPGILPRTVSACVYDAIAAISNHTPTERISNTANWDPLVPGVNVIVFAPDSPPAANVIAPLAVDTPIVPKLMILGINEITRVSGFIAISVAAVDVPPRTVTTVDTTLRPPSRLPTIVSVWVDDVNAIFIPPKNYYPNPEGLGELRCTSCHCFQIEVGFVEHHSE